MLQTRTKLKERFLIRRNGTKRANFRQRPLFQATYKKKKKEKERQTTNLTYLVSVEMGEAGGRKRARD